MSFSLLVSALLVVRILSALFSVIDDCDEVYNYWEPVHYLTYGTGMQTWEHSPEFALRSYAYACLWAIPAKAAHFLLSLVVDNPSVLVFYFVRLTLGGTAALAEVAFARALSKQFGHSVSYYFLLFQILTTGAFQASCALLPSSSFMILSMWVWAFFLEGWVTSAVLMSVATMCLTWPFSALCFVPFGLVVLHTRGVVFAFGTALLGLLICIPLFGADSYFYGRYTLAAANLIQYNVFDQGRGSALYGVAPWYYYIKNAALNLNVILLLAITTPYFAFKRYTTMQDPRRPLFFVLYTPCIIWFAIMSRTPHKEERFLYPIYPLLTAAAAIATANFSNKKHFNTIRRIITIFVTLCVAILGLSRTTGLILNYGAQTRLWLHVSTLPQGSIICSGDAWYRFQSSFFLPPGGRLEFYKDGFRGALPTHFTTSDTIPSEMNDMNREVPSLYVKPQSCDYIAAEFDSANTTSFLGTQIKVVQCWDLLDRSTSFPRRAFWLPLAAAQWTPYCLARVTQT